MINNQKHFSNQILEDLQTRYNKSTLTKKELSHELDISVSSINTYIGKGYGIPQYIKLPGKNGTVRFPIMNVVDYLSNTILVS